MDGGGGSATPQEFFAGSPLGLRVFDRVSRLLCGDPADRTVAVGRSQVAFRAGPGRGRGFAFLWLPGRYLRRPDAEVVLSIALPRPVRSARFKEVAHPAPHVWMHHLEVRDAADLDAEVAGWLREAAGHAARPR
ncbi:DUF5655 domain-containing protein [Streptomyces sp. CC210A]|uniref:DUF5655 domain-containing protein n=1 Tax=Streptomyces sp. CC210A TaxID=2898184 RepID=UPI001F192A67|nr:DUF5655 domain-containing protein [Streptomyces sp. CC210A]